MPIHDGIAAFGQGIYSKLMLPRITKCRRRTFSGCYAAAAALITGCRSVRSGGTALDFGLGHFTGGDQSIHATAGQLEAVGAHALADLRTI